MNRLPLIFARERGQLAKAMQPSVVIELRQSLAVETSLSSREGLAPSPTWPCWWFEHRDYGVLVRTPEESLRSISETANDSRLRAYYGKGRYVDVVARGVVLNPAAYPAAYSDVVNDLLAMILYLHRTTQLEAPAGTLTGTSLSPRLFGRQGDTLRYAPIAALRRHPSQGPQTPNVGSLSESGIRKREHEVRGHWRVYKTGVRVWVRGHRRGDPDLGTVTRVIRG